MPSSSESQHVNLCLELEEKLALNFPCDGLIKFTYNIASAQGWKALVLGTVIKSTLQEHKTQDGKNVCAHVKASPIKK